MPGDIQTLTTVFTARTAQFQAGIARMQVRLKQLSLSTAKAGKAIGASFAKIGLASVAATGFAIAHFAAYEKRMVAVKAVTGATGEEYKKLQAKAKQMGATTIFTAEQSAEAMQVMAMAGLDTTEIMMAIGPAMELAAAGEVSVAEAADIAAKTMRGMQLSASDLTTVNNVLVGALTTSNTNMTQLGEALKYVAPLSAATSTSIEDTVAAIGKLSDAGFQGSMAGTGLRMVMTRLSGAIPAVTNKLSKMGVQTQDSAGNMLPLFDIIGAIESKGLTAGKVMELFGARAGPQMLALLGIGADALRDYSAELHEADVAGVAAKITQEKLNSVWGQWKLMVSAVSGVVIDAVEGMLSSVRGLQASFLSFFDDQEKRQKLIDGLAAFFKKTIVVVQELVKWMVQLSPAIGKVFSIIGLLIGGIASLLERFPALLAGVIGLKVAMMMGLIPAMKQVVISLYAMGKAMVLTLGTQMKAVVMAIYSGFMPALAAAKVKIISLKFAMVAAGYAGKVAWAMITLGASLVVVALISALAFSERFREKMLGWITAFIPGIKGAGNAVKQWFTHAWYVFIQFLEQRVVPALFMMAQFFQREMVPAFRAVWTVIKNELLPVFTELFQEIWTELKPVLEYIAKVLL